MFRKISFAVLTAISFLALLTVRDWAPRHEFSKADIDQSAGIAEALAQGSPAQWGYSFVGNVSTALYPGNVTVLGTLTANISPGSLALPAGDIFVGNASNVAAGVAPSGDLTLGINGLFTVTQENGHAFPTTGTAGHIATMLTTGMYSDSGNALSAFPTLSGNNAFTGNNTFSGNNVFSAPPLIAGITNGANVAAGNVGEVMSNTNAAISSGSSFANFNMATVTLTPGLWLIYGGAQDNLSTVFAAGGQTIAISSASASLGGISNTTLNSAAFSAATTTQLRLWCGMTIVNISTSTQYWLVGNFGYTGTVPTWNATLAAVRLN